jgi:2-methylcitrate dehydratase PrpD
MGWHITGTAGVFGSAAACGKLLGLDAQQMAWAIGVAASQPVGLKIQFGSMTKSFHPGRAAQNGMVAALLAQQGFTSADAPLEGKDGWGQALSTRRDWTQVTEGLGSRYEAALNTYKPFACGIVTHPAIDAAIQLKAENHLTGAEVESAVLHANPLVLSLTGKTDPQTGLEGKFSIYHCIAMGLLQGAAGERQFSDAAVKDPAAVALRHKVSVRTDPAVKSEQCDLTLTLKDGRTLTKHIEHAVGSLERPMSDMALEAKFEDLARDVLPAERIRRLMDLCWKVEGQADAGEIARTGAA